MADNDKANKLHSRQRRAIEALLTGQTITDAADHAGVTRQTVTRWLAQPEFKSALAEAQSAALAAFGAGLVGLSESALQVLAEAMTDERTANRLRAASIHANSLLRIAELVDLAARVEALEQRLKGNVQ